MKTKFWQQFRKTETLLLSFLLYGIILVYAYEYSKIANKYEPWTTDEFFYYVEAKAISAYNLYQAPASLDGNTSYIGDFGFHGVSYALKDGWLSKVLMHSTDPPLVLINFLTCLATLALILFFKPFSLNTRIKIALIVSTHYILFLYTLSYMQETIQYFFAVLALRSLYLIYTQTIDRKNNYIIYYLAIVILAITFRYGWFMWGLGVLPLATSLKSFGKLSVVAISLMVFGVFVSRYIAAPYPYGDLVADNIIGSEKFSIMNSLNLIWQKFTHNLLLFLTPDEKPTTTCMRYLLLLLLVVSTWFAIVKRSKFTIACTLIGWSYFFAALAFYVVYWEYDERALAVLNPLLAFSLIGNCNALIFYPVISIQLILFPGVVKITDLRNMTSISINTSNPERISREASYSKIKDLIDVDESVVIELGIDFIVHGTQNYFIDLPLENSNGYPIHYKIYREGKDLRGIHHSHYVLNAFPLATSGNSQLIYSDKWIYLYRILQP